MHSLFSFFDRDKISPLDYWISSTKIEIFFSSTNIKRLCRGGFRLVLNVYNYMHVCSMFDPEPDSYVSRYVFFIGQNIIFLEAT